MARNPAVDGAEIDRFLDRRCADHPLSIHSSLGEALAGVLERLQAVVPGASGSLLLDERAPRSAADDGNHLLRVATFGASVDGLGERVDSAAGAIGRAYTSGRRLQEGEAIVLPIHVGRQVCGVLEVSRAGVAELGTTEARLLEILAEHLSATIRSALDQRRARDIAQRDALTELFNDRSMHLALSEMIGACRASGDDLAVLFLDLDYFKRINDTHGHLTGSQVLREVGHLLARASAPVGAVAARYGGDEFVIAVSGMRLDAAIEMAEGIRVEIAAAVFCEEPSDLQSEVLKLRGVTCSIGIATLHRHGDPEVDVERCKSRLLRLSDAAMYVAKETGRNRTAVAGAVISSHRLAADRWGPGGD